MSYSQRRSFSVFSRFRARATSTRSACPHEHARARNTHTHTHTRRFVCFNGRSFAQFFFFFFLLNTSTSSFFVKIDILARFYLAWPMAVACSFILRADRLRSLTLYNALAQRSRIFVSYLFIYFFISLISLFIISRRRINDSSIETLQSHFFFSLLSV